MHVLPHVFYMFAFMRFAYVCLLLKSNALLIVIQEQFQAMAFSTMGGLSSQQQVLMANLQVLAEQLSKVRFCPRHAVSIS